jgi:molecular chaperone GrpE
MDKKPSKNKKVDKSAERVKELETKLLEMEENWKRALADYKNLEKRVAQEKTTLVDFANSVLIENMLPTLDNFVMLEHHTKDAGIKMSIKELVNVLENSGLKEIEVNKGDDFDPNLMDAVDSEQGQENKVVEVVRAGYTFRERLIRPVSVKVGRGNKA